MAPEIPTAIYKSGTTTFPVCPTWWSLLIYPASTAARDAPTAAFTLSVVEPSMSGIGGRLQTIFVNSKGEVSGIDASTQVPKSYKKWSK